MVFMLGADPVNMKKITGHRRFTCAEGGIGGGGLVLGSGVFGEL